MKRLFTFGCSYTYYMWPTWADFLSLEYDYYENWGMTGIGNRAIAERIAECHAKNQFTKDDTIVVQWSTILRHDWHNNKPIVNPSGWQTRGNAFSPINSKLYNQKWYDTFYCEKSWTMHTLNHIALTQGLLDSIGCTWRMTSLGDIKKLGSDLDKDIWNYERIKIDSSEVLAKYLLWIRYPEFKCYSKIWDNYQDHWAPSIMPFSSKHDDLYWWFQASHDKAPWKEAHPSPFHHNLWVNECLRPLLGFSGEHPNQEKIIKRCIELKNNKEFMDCLKFENYLMKSQDEIFPELSWPPCVLGF